MNISKGKTPRPRRVLLYGTKGIGKSTWANNAPHPLFLNIEDGLDDLDCEKTDWLTTLDQVYDAISFLYSTPTPYKSIVVDSADWLEGLIFKAVAIEAGKASIDQIGYGKGYNSAADKLTSVLEGLDYIRRQHGKNIIFLAHDQVTKFSAPGGESYDRYSPALHKEMSAVLTEWVDEVLFATYEVFTRKEDLGFNKTRNIGTGTGARIIRTQETPAVVAKNRLNLLDPLPMDWSAYQAHWSTPEAPHGNIAGVVVDGSSKRTA